MFALAAFLAVLLGFSSTLPRAKGFIFGQPKANRITLRFDMSVSVGVGGLSSGYVHDSGFLDFTGCPGDQSIALVILNSDVGDWSGRGMPPMLAHLFGLCSYVICADGGANRLYDLCGLAHSSGEVRAD